MSTFNSAKLIIVEATGLAKDALHIYVAIGVFLGVCLLLRWRAHEWRVLFAVLIVALIGEALDVRDNFRSDRMTYPSGHLHDLWNTMLAPTLLFLTARFTHIFEKPAVDAPLRDEPDPGSGDQT